MTKLFKEGAASAIFMDSHEKPAKLSVIIPAYNEVSTIDELIEKVKSAKLPGVVREIVVVDDFSTDGTREKLARMKDIRVFFHDRNQGKGSTIRTGLAKATGDIMLFQDADLEYDPDDYSRLVEPILSGRAVVVYGLRCMKMNFRFWGNGKNILPLHYIGNKLLTLLTNILYGRLLSDMETGYKVFKSDVVRGLHLRAKRFDLEPEITAKLLKCGYTILEVPISYSARGFERGKKITWLDGVKAAWYLLKYRFVD